MKILKIEGFRGMVTMAFAGVCLFAGFVIFPGYVAMILWNKILTSMFAFPLINIFQGVLLWGIAIVSYCIVFKNGFAVSFLTNPSELSDAELNMIMENARMYSRFNHFGKPNENPYLKKEENKSDDTDKNVSNG